MDETAIAILAYLGIGFVATTVYVAIIGPKPFLRSLCGEASFELVKSMTPEEARKSDEEFGMWLGVFFLFFLWPMVLVCAAIFVVLLAIIGIGSLIRHGIKMAFHAKGDKP